mmetsp:Transcript_4192/g.18990  ORF Transcript_4192/g.18990 Transcript_4192/m.18990 type:complete len:209 (-) Transcript_4192:300-926(-)
MTTPWMRIRTRIQTRTRDLTIPTLQTVNPAPTAPMATRRTNRQRRRRRLPLSPRARARSAVTSSSPSRTSSRPWRSTARPAPAPFGCPSSSPRPISSSWSSARKSPPRPSFDPSQASIRPTSWVSYRKMTRPVRTRFASRPTASTSPRRGPTTTSSTAKSSPPTTCTQCCKPSGWKPRGRRWCKKYGTSSASTASPWTPGTSPSSRTS